MTKRAVLGVTLQQYAAIYAASSEGFPLDLVLESEGLSPSQWAAIDQAWGDEIASDLLEGGTLSDDFDLALLEAQDRYRRPIPPLDDDLPSWLRFVRAWAAAADPFEYLRERGLGANDLSRLHRAWSARLADDADLQKQALAILEADGAPPIPHPEPLELRPVGVHGSLGTRSMQEPTEEPPTRAPSLRVPLPASGAPPSDVSRPAASPAAEDENKTWIDGPLPLEERPDDQTQVPESSGANAFDAVRLPEGFAPPPVDTVIPADPSVLADELTLAQYAALCAELDVSPPEDALAVFIKYGLANDQRRARIDALWRERLETRTTTYAEWRKLFQHFREHFLSLRKR